MNKDLNSLIEIILSFLNSILIACSKNFKNLSIDERLKLINKIFNVNPFISGKIQDVVINGEVIDNENINKTFDANQQINPDSRNLPKGASKTDLGLLLVIVALVFVVILYFIFR